MIQETTKQAYDFIRADLGHRQQVVLNALKTLKVSNNKLMSHFLGIPINQITPRVKELRELKYITVSHEGNCPITGRNTIWWKLTKWGDLASKIIENPKAELLEPLPFQIEHGFEDDRFTAQYLASNKKDVYNVELRIQPDGMMEFNCECYDFVNTKQTMEPCKHCINLKNVLKRHGQIDGTYYFKEIKREVQNEQ